MRRDTKKGRKKKQDVTGTLSSRTTGGGGLDGYRMTAFGECADDNKASTVKARDYKDATDLVAFSCKDYAADSGPVSPTLRSMNNSEGNANAGGQVAIAFQCHGSNVGPMGTLRSGNGNESGGVPFLPTGVTIHGTDKTQKVMSYTDLAGSLRTKPPGSQENSSTTAVLQDMAVRRLTPLECERLQGFPDNWTAITYRGKPATDGPRYKAIGNSMAVPVMRWIGERLATVG
jgi:DNA (cytosine-5)-methyltransferase 1